MFRYLIYLVCVAGFIGSLLWLDGFHMFLGLFFSFVLAVIVT